MRAHRLALAARRFAEVTVIGPAKHLGKWAPLPPEPWIRGFESKNLPKFYHTALEMIEAAEGDVLLAVKPYLASFGVALLAGRCRKTPVVLDLDDLDEALVPPRDLTWQKAVADLRDPASLLYLEVLASSTQAASAITVASTNLQKRFGGTVVPHGCPVEQFDPGAVDREAARKRFGFSGPVVLFPGTRRPHKGLKPLARAVGKIKGARLAVLCRETDYIETKWEAYPLIKLPLVPYAELPALLAAADVVAIPQLNSECARHQMPMKVYDSMAMARPIVATTVSDLPATLDGCARLVPPGDVPSLTSAICDLLEHPKEAAAMGARARARCLQNYSMEQVAAALKAAIESARSKYKQTSPA
jgi:glycosyltransferase involved in cell wall biosynthesis